MSSEAPRWTYPARLRVAAEAPAVRAVLYQGLLLDAAAAYERLEAALAVAREREQRLRSALRDAIANLDAAVCVDYPMWAALVDEPAAAGQDAAPVLATPSQEDAAGLTAAEAGAAADEPQIDVPENRRVEVDALVKARGALVEIIDLSRDEPGGLNFATRASKIARDALGWEKASAAADEPGETPA